MMTMPAMALILLGCVIWIHRAFFSEKINVLNKIFVMDHIISLVFQVNIC